MNQESWNKVQYHTKKTLIPSPVADGARMWSVALKKTMLTFFEVKPNSRFDRHSHISEQITLVLEGELYFNIGERLIHVKRGEVIAIPSNTPHEAFTKKKSAKAVDAWSPVMEKYKLEDAPEASLENERRLASGVGMKP